MFVQLVGTQCCVKMHEPKESENARKNSREKLPSPKALRRLVSACLRWNKRDAELWRSRGITVFISECRREKRHWTKPGVGGVSLRSHLQIHIRRLNNGRTVPTKSFNKSQRSNRNTSFTQKSRFSSITETAGRLHQLLL